MYKRGTTRNINNHPEYNWNASGVKKLLKKINETDEVAPKEGSGRPKSVRTVENIELVEEMILSKEYQLGMGTHSTPAEIVHDLNIDRQSVYRKLMNTLIFVPRGNAMRKNFLIQTLKCA